MSSWKRTSFCAMRPELGRRAHRHCREEGFILGLAMVMLLVLAVAGLGFSQLDALERGIAWQEVDSHSAFYLASAGLERARTAFKAQPVAGTLRWTPLLRGTVARYPLDPNPNAGGWPNPCVIPSFQTNAANPNVIPPNRDGDPVTPVSLDPTIPPDLPFSGTLTQGSYTLRAFDNEDEPTGPNDPTTDRDLILTVRAVGSAGITHVQRKVLEINLLATTDMDLINCQGSSDNPCPDVVHGNPIVQPSPGRDPGSHPVLPSLPPLRDSLNPDTCNAANYYCNPDNLNTWRNLNRQDLPPLTPRLLSGDITLTDSPHAGEVQLEDNSYYFTDGSVQIDHVSNGRNIVIVSLGDIRVGSDVRLTEAVLVADKEVRLSGRVTISSPAPFPAAIGGDAVQADSNVEVFGGLYSSGTIDLNPIRLHGVLIGNEVEIQGGSGSLYTDDGNPVYYAPMPGFDYPGDLVTTRIVEGSWRERSDLE